MAEAAVDSRFFCHQCAGEILPVMPGFTCPDCESGFIEEISAELEEERRGGGAPGRDPHDPNPVTDAFFDMWGRHFLTSLGAISSPSESPRHSIGTTGAETSSSSSSGSDDAEDSGYANDVAGTSSSYPSTRSRTNRDAARMAQTARVVLGGDASGGPRRASAAGMDPSPVLQGMIASILQNLTGGGGGGAAFMTGGIPIAVGEGGGGGNLFGLPMNMFQIHGNPGDYAWGSGGLDAVISQLLNQLDGSGAPPAPADVIDSLPTVKIAQEQIDMKVQCSVCMEDYILGETVTKLPCEHLFHKDCIVPWLELHGTCPVCRKGLTNDANENNNGDGSDEGGEHGGSEDGATDGGDGGHGSFEGLLRNAGGNINIFFGSPGSQGGNHDGEAPLNSESTNTLDEQDSAEDLDCRNFQDVLQQISPSSEETHPSHDTSKLVANNSSQRMVGIGHADEELD